MEYHCDKEAKEMLSLSILRQFADVTGWSVPTQLHLLCNFLDDQGHTERLAEFLNAQLRWDDECAQERLAGETDRKSSLVEEDDT